MEKTGVPYVGIVVIAPAPKAGEWRGRRTMQSDLILISPSQFYFLHISQDICINVQKYSHSPKMTKKKRPSVIGHMVVVRWRQVERGGGGSRRDETEVQVGGKLYGFVCSGDACKLCTLLPPCLWSPNCTQSLNCTTKRF